MGFRARRLKRIARAFALQLFADGRTGVDGNDGRLVHERLGATTAWKHEIESLGAANLHFDQRTVANLFVGLYCGTRYDSKVRSSSIIASYCMA